MTTSLADGMLLADPPFYFKRAWDDLTIYGRRVRPLAEDEQVVKRWEQNGRVYAACYSTQCVEGECGTHPQEAIEEVSAEEFAAARERGWA